MKICKSTFFFMILLSLISCGDDSDGDIIREADPIVEDGPFDKVAVVAVSQDQIYQLDVSFKTKTVEETNLTKDYEVEMPDKIFTSDTRASFLYRQAGQDYSFKTKSFQNQNVEMHDRICGFESNNMEGAFGATVVEDYLLVFTGSGDSYDILSVWSKHLPTGNCQKITFGQGYDYDFNKILYEEDQLVVSFTDLSGQYSISYIDLFSGTSTTTSFDRYYSATLIDGMVHMLFYGDSTIYEVYDPRDWSLMKNDEFSDYLNFGSNGLVSTQMYESKVLINFQYGQPGPVGEGPGTVNLMTGEFESMNQFLSQIKRELEIKYDANILITTYKADLETETLVVGYEVKGFDGSISGGLLLSDFEAIVDEDIALPYTPFSFEFVD